MPETRTSHSPRSGLLVPFGEDVWLAEGGTIQYCAPPFPVPLPYTLRSVVVRLADGDLWVYSPVELRDALGRALDALGPVRHLVAPNKLHHLFLARWVRRYPEARLYAPAGLASKRPDLTFHATLDASHDPWAGELDLVVVSSSAFMAEAVFFHRKTRTLILGDLVENHDPARFNPLQRAIGRFNCMLAPRGQTPRNFRWSFLRRGQARDELRRVQAFKPEYVVMLHGPCVTRGADEFLRQAFAWACG